MTREEIINEIKPILEELNYPDAVSYLTKNDRRWLEETIQALEQQPCDDWHDVPSDEMTLEQARQAVKDLRKKLAEYLTQQPCEDTISRQAVLEQTYNWSKDEFLRVTNPFDYLRKRISSLPPVQPQPKMGKWINLEKTKYKGQVLPFWGRYECSECGNHGQGDFYYCPSCGRKMGVEE